MSSDTAEKSFISVFEELFSFLGVDSQFVTIVPLSTLSNVLEYNVLVGVSGSVKGNIMYSYNEKIFRILTDKIIGNINFAGTDIFIQNAIYDFFIEFSKRVMLLAEMSDEDDKKVLLASPIGVMGHNINAMISQVPSKNLFFKVCGEKLAVAFFLEKA